MGCAHSAVCAGLPLAPRAFLAPPWSAVSVLWVDDDAVVLRAAKALLPPHVRGDFVHCAGASTAHVKQRARTALALDPNCVLVIDNHIGIPGFTGVQCIRDLRSAKEARTAPALRNRWILASGSHVASLDPAALRRLGVVVMEKPFTRAGVWQTLRLVTAPGP